MESEKGFHTTQANLSGSKLSGIMAPARRPVIVCKKYSIPFTFLNHTVKSPKTITYMKWNNKPKKRSERNTKTAISEAEIIEDKEITIVSAIRIQQGSKLVDRNSASLIVR
jgi:hypothetical protein